MFLELKKQGWQCIPLIPGTKKPIEKLDRLGGFIGIHHDGVPDEICKEWDKKYNLKNCGLGLIAGKSSNVSVIDLDTNCEEILKIIPPSPLIKKGRNLGSYFFQHMPDFKSKEVFGARELDDSVEFLNHNMLVVLPPSIHPTTKKPFVWSGEVKSLKNFTPSQLPTIGTKELEAIQAFYKKKYKMDEFDALPFEASTSAANDLDDVYPATLENGRLRCAHGSQDRIKRRAAQLIADHTPIEQAVKELVRYDLEHHTGLSYFQDKSRGRDSSSGDPHISALRFYSSLLGTINENRKRRGEDSISIIHASTPKVAEENVEKKQKEENKKKMPAITGMMKTFVDYLNKSSVSENTQVYLGASLAWLSMLVASRFAVKTAAFTTPANLMLWGVMPSGVGKESPQSLIQDLLYSHNVLGASNYKSAPSLIMNMKNIFKEKSKSQELVRKAQRENLILIDECSSLFRIMAKGEQYQQDMVETLNTLFSKSSGFFAGDQSVDRGIRYGAAYNPYFTLMGFTTYNHFEAVSGSRIIGNGFFERSLVFIKNKKSKFNDNPEKDDELFRKLKDFTDSHLSVPVKLVDYGEFIEPEKEITTEVAYSEFPITDEAEKALHSYRKDMYEKEGDEMDEAFFNRFGELATKLSLLHAVSDGRSEIELSDVEWGVQLVEWCYSKARKVFIKIQDQDDAYRAAVEKIEKAISKKSDKKISRKELLQYTRFEPKNAKRAQFLNELIELGLVTTENVAGMQWIRGRQTRPEIH